MTHIAIQDDDGWAFQIPMIHDLPVDEDTSNGVEETICFVL